MPIRTATEPLFVVLLSAVFWKKGASWRVYASLVPLVAGIALLALTDLNITGGTLATIAVSNVCFGARSLLAKPLLAPPAGIDNLALFFHISWLSAAVLFPLAWWSAERAQWPLLAAAGEAGLAPRVAANAVLHYAYNQLSFLVLDRVTPLSHSIANALRRFVIIVGSMLFFGTPFSRQSQLGIALLVLGAAGYAGAQAAPQPPLAPRKTE